MPVEVQMKFYDVWAPSKRTTTCPPAGRGRSTRRSTGSSRTPRGWRHQPEHGRVVACEIKDTGGLRRAVHPRDRRRADHSQASGLSAPLDVDGIKQAPIEGTSFAYTFDAQNAKHRRGIRPVLRDDGSVGPVRRRWLLATKVNRVPWGAFGPANRIRSTTRYSSSST